MCRSHYHRYARYGDPKIAKVETHGMRNTSEYNSWYAMKDRCNNKNNIGYKNYGGRGITVCEKWQNSFTAFINDMGRKPSPKHTIDRIDVNRGYSPENCRWATYSEQGINKNISPKNKIGVKGVLWLEQHQKWLAYIKRDQRHYHLGYFTDISEAIGARMTAEAIF